MITIISAIPVTAVESRKESLETGTGLYLAGEDLLAGGPVLGPGAGLLLDYHPFHKNTFLISSGISAFLMPELMPEKKPLTPRALHVHCDGAFAPLVIEKFNLHLGAGLIYDWTDSPGYRVQEMSVELFSRASYKTDRLRFYLQGVLETGGFDTWMISFGVLKELN